jgi:bacterioferritin-associated ferredoxin
MIVCSCNVLSDHDIRSGLESAAERPSPGAVFRRLGCEAKCGRCARNIASLVERHAGTNGAPGGAGRCSENEIAA